MVAQQACYREHWPRVLFRASCPLILNLLCVHIENERRGRDRKQDAPFSRPTNQILTPSKIFLQRVFISRKIHLGKGSKTSATWLILLKRDLKSLESVVFVGMVAGRAMALNQFRVAQCCPICKGNSAIRELLSACPSCPFSISSSSLSEPLHLLMVLSSQGWAQALSGCRSIGVCLF